MGQSLPPITFELSSKTKSLVAEIPVADIKRIEADLVSRGFPDTSYTIDDLEIGDGSKKSLRISLSELERLRRMEEHGMVNLPDQGRIAAGLKRAEANSMFGSAERK